MKKKSVYIVGSIVFIILSLWTFRFLVANQLLNLIGKHPKQKYLSMSPEAELKKFELKIKSDYLNIKNIELFQKKPISKSDAGVFLNSRLSWSGLDLNPNRYPLKLSAEVVQAITASFKNPRIKFNWSKYKLDFTWFNKIHDFDHWNYDSFPPFDKNSKTYTFFNLPSPKFTELLFWSKLRLLKGNADGDIDGAIKDVRQLAQLILSTEDFIGTMISISILESENTFRKSFYRNLYTLIDPISEDKIKSAKRFYFSQAGFLDLRLSDEMFEINKSYTIGLCQRIYSTILNVKAYKKVLLDDLSSAFERLDYLVIKTDKICRKSYVRQKWKDPEFQALLTQDQDLSSVANQNYGLSLPNKSKFFGTTIKDLEKNPNLSKLMMYILLEVSQPDYLNLYRKSELDSNM